MCVYSRKKRQSAIVNARRFSRSFPRGFPTFPSHFPSRRLIALKIPAAKRFLDETPFLICKRENSPLFRPFRPWSLHVARLTKGCFDFSLSIFRFSAARDIANPTFRAVSTFRGLFISNQFKQVKLSKSLWKSSSLFVLNCPFCINKKKNYYKCIDPEILSMLSKCALFFGLVIPFSSALCPNGVRVQNTPTL